jgi:hypothetical protein
MLTVFFIHCHRQPFLNFDDIFKGKTLRQLYLYKQRGCISAPNKRIDEVWSTDPDGPNLGKDE